MVSTTVRGIISVNYHCLEIHTKQQCGTVWQDMPLQQLNTVYNFWIYFAGNKKTDNVAGARSWNQKSRKAYGICMSLYDQHPINGKISGLLSSCPLWRTSGSVSTLDFNKDLAI